MYILFMIILTFFAVIGISVFLFSLFRMLAAAGAHQQMLVVLPKISAENAEIRLRAAVADCKRIKGGKVICLCDDDNEDVGKICACVENGCHCVEIMSPEEFIEKFKTAAI